MDDTWTTRELPALQALVEYFDDPDASGRGLTRPQAAELAKMDEETFRRALSKLARADPPFLDVVIVEEDLAPTRITGVTERALVTAGQWPSAEALADRLVDALHGAADAESEPGRKKLLHSVAAALGGIAKQVTVEVLTSMLSPH